MLEPAVWSAIALSLKVASLSLALILVPGLALGWLLARSRFPGKSLLEALVYAPLVLPPVVTGYVLLLTLGRRAWLGQFLEQSFGWRISFTFFAAVVAAAVMSLPLLVRSIRLAIELVDRNLEVAAATLGAGRLRTFFTITLPLALPGVLTGMTLAFARGLGEFGATMVFAGNLEGQTRTIPLAVFTNLQTPGGEATVVALAVVSFVLALGALLLSEWSVRHGRARLEPQP
jgi:molybdate transport system permease protein